MNRINWPAAIVIAFLVAAAFASGVAMAPHLLVHCAGR